MRKDEFTLTNSDTNSDTEGMFTRKRHRHRVLQSHHQV